LQWFLWMFSFLSFTLHVDHNWLLASVGEE
jgi:hypothetical protein